MNPPRKRLWFLMGLLAFQIPAWLILITKVPVMSLKYGTPDFAIDHPGNRASMLLRLSGSHVWGMTVGDAHLVDLDSGKLSQVSAQEHEAMLERDRVSQVTRSIRIGGEGTIEILTYDPASTGGLAIQSIEFPEGSQPTMVNQRYVLGADETRLFLWDALNPKDGVRVYPSPLESPGEFREIHGSNLAFCLRDSPQVDSQSGASAAPPRSPVGKSPFPVLRPSSGKKPQRVRRLLLFRIDAADGPKLVARWNVFSHDSRWFSDVVTRVNDRLVSISSDGQRFEYRSDESGMLVDERPLPNGFEPDRTDWAFDGGRIHVGSRRAGPLFDLATNDWLPHPGEGYVMTKQWREADIGVYSSVADARLVVLDHRSGVTLLELPEQSGRPELVDANTLAICSTRCGFGVDVLDLQSGALLASWTPWWWVPTLLIACLAGYVWWSWAWMSNAATAGTQPLLDVVVVLGVFVVVFYFRFKWADIYGIDNSVVDELIRGICCSVLAVACCALVAARARLITRLLVVAFVVAGIGAITRLLFDTTFETGNDEGLLVQQTSYYETFQAMCYLFVPAFFAAISYLILLACGFRVSVAGELSQPTSRRPTWRIADLLLLIASTSALLAVYSSLLPEARSELSALQGNSFFASQWKQLVVTGPLVVAVAMATLARPGILFGLAGCFVLASAVYVGWSPILDFVMPAIGVYSADPMRVLATSLIGAFVICLPYRLRGWQVSYHYKASNQTRSY